MFMEKIIHPDVDEYNVDSKDYSAIDFLFYAPGKKITHPDVDEYNVD